MLRVACHAGRAMHDLRVAIGLHHMLCRALHGAVCSSFVWPVLYVCASGIMHACHVMRACRIMLSR